MSAKGACQTSRSFWYAHQRCCVPEKIGPNSFKVPLFPDLVLIAFSIEVGLKALALQETSSALKTHEIMHLFNDLPEATRARIKSGSGLSDRDFAVGLFELNTAFVQLRYLYEKGTWSGFIGSYPAIGKGVQEALDDAFPPDPNE